MLDAVERERLDRRALLVGVEPDVAEEHAVGPRHRLLAQRHRLRTAEAVRQHAQALAQLRRAGAGAGRERLLVEAQLGELLRDVRRDPGHRSACTLRASSASSSCSNEVPATLPPRRANVIVGQIATA